MRPRIRFSLLGLMALVAYTAMACAALRYATELWASSLFTLAIFVYLFAVLAIVWREGATRAGWIGFLVFGGGYLLLANGPWPQADLVTNRGLGWIEQQIHGETPTPALNVATVSSPWINSTATFTTSQVLLWDTTTGRSLTSSTPSPAPTFVRIGHTLLSPLIGLLGVLAASWLCTSAERPRERNSSDSSSKPISGDTP
jgi:hypothetical protein